LHPRKIFFFRIPHPTQQIRLRSDDLTYMRIQRHICEFAELDGEGGILEEKKLRGSKSNRNFYMGENQR